MALNQDYTTFPSPPRASLDATTAHEFKHSLQFGYGALDDATEPELNFSEGMATWMEDEVQDGANDNYFYLYPEFDDSMGQHGGDEYAYWLTFRGMFERFGANVPGGSEQVSQDFWETISYRGAVMLDALNVALTNKGRSLPETFHDYAIAAKLMRPCGGGYFRPYCFEEAAGYLAVTGGPPDSQGSINSAGQSDPGSIEDNYTIHWVDLPAAGSYDVELENTSAGGALRATLACDTGTAIAILPMPAVVGAGGSTAVDGFDPSSCDGRPVAAITNQAQTAADPETNTTRSYIVRTTSASPENAPAVPPQPTEEPPDNSLNPGPPTTTTSTPGSSVVRGPIQPLVSGIKLASRRFRAARSGAAIRTAARTGTRVRYRLNVSATLLVRYERRTVGRRLGARCRKATLRNRGRKACVRWVVLRGSARDEGRTGSNLFRLMGRLRGRAVKPGVYRLRVAARNAAPKGSPTRRSASFRVVRR